MQVKHADGQTYTCNGAENAWKVVTSVEGYSQKQSHLRNVVWS
jgi:hypothetical protein